MGSVVVTILGVCMAIALLAVVRTRRRWMKRWHSPPAEALAAEIISKAGEGIAVFDRDLRCALWNRFMEELTGLRENEVLGRTPPERVPNFDSQEVVPMVRRAFAGETFYAPDARFAVPETGRTGWVSAFFGPFHDDRGAVAGVIVLVRDITERKSAEEQIEYQAYHDALTGLANRLLFREHLTLALALSQRRWRYVAVLFLDLDHFKTINDTRGHACGDALLGQIASRLRSCVREGDTIARVGGDEFALVLQDLDKRGDAALVATKLLNVVAEPLELDGERLSITTSIGIAVFPGDGDDADDLLRNADNAMYRAKARGRNTFELAAIEPGESAY
jgi:diguanylate cyclase (GGDEF)-like protein/PAS domain S-box-containing protein